MDKKEKKTNQATQGKCDSVFILTLDPAKMLCDPVDEGSLPRINPNCCLDSVLRQIVWSYKMIRKICLD